MEGGIRRGRMGMEDRAVLWMRGKKSVEVGGGGPSATSLVGGVHQQHVAVFKNKKRVGVTK